MVKKKESVWNSYKIVVITIAGLAAMAGVFGAIATWHLAFTSVPEIKEEIKNSTFIERGRCLIPNALYGVVKNQGERVGSATIMLTNINTNETKVLKTNEQGEWVESVGNFRNCWIGGDDIKISACFSDKCYDKELIYSLDGGGIQVDFDT